MMLRQGGSGVDERVAGEVEKREEEEEGVVFQGMGEEGLGAGHY